MYRLVIVEDEKAIRDAIVSFVDWAGIGMMVAAVFDNGQEAWEFVLKEKPDCLLTDIRMPGMDGLELIHQVHGSGLKTRSVILSGYEDFGYARLAIQSGVHDYLLKPVDFELIGETFHRLKLKLEKEAAADRLLEEARTLKTEHGANRFVWIDDGLDEKEMFKKPQRKLIENARQYVEKHYSQDLSLPVVAQQVHLNPSYFSRLFKHETGRQFIQYLIEVRINRAKELLKDPQYKIYEVSELVGYNDYKSFSKVFKKREGISPYDYKARKM